MITATVGLKAEQKFSLMVGVYQSITTDLCHLQKQQFVGKPAFHSSSSSVSCVVCSSLSLRSGGAHTDTVFWLLKQRQNSKSSYPKCRTQWSPINQAPAATGQTSKQESGAQACAPAAVTWLSVLLVAAVRLYWAATQQISMVKASVWVVCQEAWQPLGLIWDWPTVFREQ